METRTKTCGPIPGGLILTHTLVSRSLMAGRFVALLDMRGMREALLEGQALGPSLDCWTPSHVGVAQN